MQEIIPRSQEGFDLVVDFTLNNGEVRTETVSIKPYYADGIQMAPALSKSGKPYLNKKGEVLMEAKKIQVWSNPADTLTEFLVRYGEALERGIEMTTAPAIPTEFFGKAI